MKEEKSVNILGCEVILKKRIAKDVNDLADWVRANNNGSQLFGFYVAATIISSSLKRSRSLLKWYQLKQRRIYEKLMNPKYLITHLDEIELTFYQITVLTLERQFNIDLDTFTLETFNPEMLTELTKKKVEESQPDDSEQKL